MIEPKYTPRTRQSGKSIQEQGEIPKSIPKRTSYEPPLYSDYEAIYGSGRFTPGEMIASAKSWV